MGAPPTLPLRATFSAFHAMAKVSYIVRIAAEVASKSNRTRRRFHRQLVANLEGALRSVGAEARVSDRWSRLFVTIKTDGEGHEAADQAMRVATRVFGVHSYSRIDALLDADLDQIERVGHELYRDAVRGRRYAVDARRAGRHDFTSRDIAVRLGGALNPYGTVDLTSPEVTVSVEVRDHRAYLHRGRTEGPGGLPVGTQGRAVCLISGGYDSAVAAWLLLKRGVALDYVFCNLAGPAYERAVTQVAGVLATRWSHGYEPRMHAIDFGEAVEQLQARVTPRYWQVVLKRLMYRAAEAVATETGAEALVTGEAVGQVSSQTLRNLRAIDASATLPVLRPLIGFDKEEIVRIAGRVGTAALSARIREYCAILEGKPVTGARVGAVDREEAPLEAQLLTRAVAARSVRGLLETEESGRGRYYLWVDEVPTGALVIDCAPAGLATARRLPDALRIRPQDLPDVLPNLDKNSQYVLHCHNGVVSAQYANIMQTMGYEAYALRTSAHV